MRVVELAYSSPPKYFGEAGVAVLQTSAAGRNCAMLLGRPLLKPPRELNTPCSTFTAPASHQHRLLL